jgi:CIC family chloride channel protein
MDKKAKDALKRLLEWRVKHISNKNFLLVCSVLIGLFAGLTAVALKRLVHFIHHLLQAGIINHQNYLFFVYPIIGILLTVTYARIFHKGKLGRGVSSILYAIARRNGNVEREKTYSHVISSALTVGFGGSAGLEAPIVVTGSAIGSNTARVLGFSGKERILLLACGAAAGIAAVFNTPIAGMIFAIEVLLAEFSIPAFIPLLIATATASVISSLFYRERLFFLITDGWHLNAIPFYVLLGVLMGLLSVYVTRMNEMTEKLFQSYKSPYPKAIVGGLVLGALIFIIPPLYGEGYGVVEHLLKGDYTHILDNSLFEDKVNDPWFILILAAGIVFIKVFATSITVGAGGNGGMFAPSLFIGASSGFVFSRLINLTGVSNLVVANFIVAGMAGALSGIIHAPLTAIFLIAEITGGYALFIPLMIVSAMSYFIARFFEPHSIYTKQLARKGYLPNDKDRLLLSRIKLKHLLETDFATIDVNASLGDLVEVIAHSKRNIFVVLDSKENLSGIVLLDDIREIMFQHELYDKTFVRDIMTQPPAVIKWDEELHKVMQKFDEHNAWNLPVIKEGKYTGFISKSKVFTHYRQHLIGQSKEVV